MVIMEEKMTTNSSIAEYAQLLEKTPEFSEAAFRYGPFFFGVFLVTVSFVLVLLNKNRYFACLFGLCGIGAMAWASLLYSGIGNPIQIYTMCIGDLSEGQEIALTDSAPLIYRHNHIYDKDQGTYHVNLASISPVKLKADHPFQIILKEKVELQRASGDKIFSVIKHKLAIPFTGRHNCYYELQRENIEEEGSISYKLVDVSNRMQIGFVDFLIPKVFADNHSTGNIVSVTGDTIDGEEQINVVYYKRSADNEVVKDALDEINVQYLTKKSNGGKPVNSVWVGAEVPADLAKKIGLQLLAEGIELKYFGYFTHQETNTNIVQIGYSKYNENTELVHKEDVISFAGRLQQASKVSQELNEQKKTINKKTQKIIYERLQKQQ